MVMPSGLKAHQAEPLTDADVDGHAFTGPSGSRRGDRPRLGGMANSEPHSVGEGLWRRGALDVVHARTQQTVVGGGIGTDQETAGAHRLRRGGSREAIDHAMVVLVHPSG